MSYKNLLIEYEENVMIVRMNRPDSLNALNKSMWLEICEVLKKADSNQDVRVVILTGSEKVFAAGADIKEMTDKSYTDVYKEDFFSSEHNTVVNFRKPIIAAVSGFALGGGCELAMMCDFILASDTAKFGQPEIKLGVIAGLGGTQRLPRYVGKSKAMEMHLTGRFMLAEESERIGLVSRVIPVNDLMLEAKKTAKEIADKSIMVTMAAKEAINRSYETFLAEGNLYERRLFHSLFSTQDQKEGMLAFIEKRVAKFSDK